MKTWKKVAAVTTASAMTVQLAGCGTGYEETVIEGPATVTYEDEYIEESYVEEYTEELIDTETEEVYDENGELVDLYESDYVDACDEWYESEDGSYVCEDEASPYYQNHFFDGLMYATIGAMVASSYYKNKNRVNGVYAKKDEYGQSSSSGGGYVGGNRTNNNSTGVTSSTQDPYTSKPSNGTNSYSSGKSGFSSGGSSRGGSSSS